MPNDEPSRGDLSGENELHAIHARIGQLEGLLFLLLSNVESWCEDDQMAASLRALIPEASQSFADLHDRLNVATLSELGILPEELPGDTARKRRASGLGGKQLLAKAKLIDRTLGRVYRLSRHWTRRTAKFPRAIRTAVGAGRSFVGSVANWLGIGDGIAEVFDLVLGAVELPTEGKDNDKSTEEGG